MKLLIIVTICACISRAQAVSTDAKAKMPTKLANTIPVPQKQQELYYPQTATQQTQDFVPVQLMPKQVFVTPQQPHTMLIIAQPAYVPQNVLYGNPAAAAAAAAAGGMQQQLLNYFHGNPQAKYQLLYGGYPPQPTPQTYIAQAPVAAQTVPAYQIVANPVYTNQLVTGPAQIQAQIPAHFQTQIPAHIQAQIPAQIQPQIPAQIAAHVPTQMAYVQPQAVPAAQMNAHYVQPLQLSQIAQFAQMAANQYGSAIKTAPPIITGLENFSPEHQAQIKASLGAHLNVPFSTPATLPATTSQQYSAPQPTQSTADYAQSQDKNTLQAASSNLSPALLYRAQFTKG